MEKQEFKSRGDSILQKPLAFLVCQETIAGAEFIKFSNNTNQEAENF